MHRMRPEAPSRPSDVPESDDADLLTKLRAGDRAAFTTLVERHGGALLRFAGTIVKDRAIAEEVVQDAWVAVLRGLDRFEGRSSLRTWLFRVVANRAHTRFVRDGRMVPFSALPEQESGAGAAAEPDRLDPRGGWVEPPSAWSEENPERLAQRRETRAVLERAVAELPDAQRAVFTLRDVEGLDADETCQLLGLTATNQRVLLHRARVRVRRALEAYLAGDP